MNSEIASAIAAGDDERAKELAARLSRLLDVAVAAGCYEDLFLRHRSMPPSAFRTASQEIKSLREAGLVSMKAGALVSNVMLHVNPHIGLVEFPNAIDTVLIATDWPDVSLDQKAPFVGREAVFPLHYESFACLEELQKRRSTRIKPPGPVLDIFCGSGVLGIYAARLGLEPVWFSDLCVRALAFTRLNAHLNRINAAGFIKSDVFAGFARSNPMGMDVGQSSF